MAGEYKLNVLQGETLRRTFTWSISGTPVDLTGYSATAAVKVGPTVYVWSTGPSGVELTLDSLGHIVLQVTHTAVDVIYGQGAHKIDANYTGSRPTYLVGAWELVLTSPGGIRTRLLQGQVSISPSVQQ